MYDPRTVTGSPPIAIVGIAAQLPSGRHSDKNLDYSAFLDFLLHGRDAYERIPEEYFNVERIRGSAVGQVKTDSGAFLKHVDQFDHVEFGVPAKEARMMSLSVRKLIETSFLALHDSGVDYRAQNVGCYMSGVAHDMFAVSGHDDTEATGAFGNAPSMLANRVSYYLNLRGPSLSVDTACSSSLYATHLAVQALRLGECDAALVGGSQLNHRFTEWLTYSRGGILSADGKCKPFDASADGFGRGEGIISIVLKPMSDALKDHDHIYATILGTGVNASGALAPANAPSAIAQVDAMRRAFLQAGRSLQDVDFVELHATGTAAGDPAEANWAGEEFQRDDEVVIGSVKGNLGHLEITAFLASLCKVCGTFESGRIPPNVNLRRLNPAIQWQKHRLRVPLEPEPLKCRSSSGRSLIAIASSGIGGANGHCVVEGPPRNDEYEVTPFWRTDVERPTLLLCGGLSPRSADATGKNLLAIAAATQDDLPSLARLFARQARSMTWKSFALLGAGCKGTFSSPVITPKVTPTMVFVFSGQGGQHFHMGRELFASCVPFRKSVLELDAVYASVVGTSLIATTGLFTDTAGEATLALGDTWPISIILPALAMIQLALVDTLAALGIRPDVVIGHSAGETAVVAASGAASKAMALELAIARGRALSHVEGENGTMAAVGCSPEQARELIASVNAELGPDTLEIGCYNSPGAVTLSGATSHVGLAVKKASDAGIFARVLRTNVPIHSGMVAPSQQSYDTLVGEVFARHDVGAPNVATFSTKTGRVYEDAFSAQYFWESTLGPVRFTDAMQALSAQYPTATFLEIGPHPALVSYIASMTNAQNLVACPVRRPKRGESSAEIAELLSTVGKTFVAGHSINLDVLYGTTRHYRGKLPEYPLTPKSIPWSIPTPERIRQRQHRNGPLNYPQLQVNVKTHPGLADHVIKGEPIMPAAGYMEMALEFGATALYDIEFHSLLSLSSERPVPVDVKLDGCRWIVNSASPGDHAKVWPIQYDRRHASGLLSMDAPQDSQVAALDIESIRKRMQPLSATDFYSTLPPFAQYGPMYRRIVQCHLATGNGGAVEALIQLRGHGDDIPNISDYRLHPAILDAAIHVLVHPCMTGNYDDDFYHLPSKIAALRLCPAFFDRPLPQSLFVHAKFVEWLPDSMTYDFTIADESGVPLCLIDRLQVALHGFRMKTLSKRYEVVYRSTELYLTLHPESSTPESAALCPHDKLHSTSLPIILTNLEVPSCPALIPTAAIRYTRGEEMQIQKLVSGFDHLSPLSLLFVASDSDLDSYAVLGFTRSLRKEYPVWTIRAATFSASCSPAQLVDGARQLLHLATDEPELRVLPDGSVEVPRIVPSAAPSEHQPFSPDRPWKLEHGTVYQTFLPKAPDSSHVVVRIAAGSSVSSNIWAYTGNADGISSTVAGIACGPVSSHVIAHRGALVELDDASESRSGVDDNQHVGPLLLAPTVVILTVGAQAFANPQRIRGLSALVVEEDTTLRSQLEAICTQLGLDVTPLASPSNTELASLRRRPSYIISSVSDEGAIRSLRSILPPRGRLFLWNHTEEGIPSFVVHDPWALGDALRLAIKTVFGSELKTSYIPPLELLGDPPSEVSRPPNVFDPHRANILLGGIGSLGMHLALWMYQNGARDLVLTSRSGTRSLDERGDYISQRILTYLESRPDLVLQTVAVDSTSEPDMRTLLADIKRPIGGCFLLSAVLADRLFTSHTKETFDVSFPPKVDVFRTLEKVVDLNTLDFVVTFSSISGMFGNPGQTSYAAANTALAGLTRKYRNAFSIVAPIIRDSRILVLSDSSYSSRVRHMTSWAMSARELCEYIGDGIKKLRDGPVSGYIPDFDWNVVRTNMGPSKLYDDLVEADVTEDADGAQDDGLPSVAQIVCRVLDIQPEDLNADVPLTAYGLDSLTAASLSFALRPLLQISQIQLLADVTTKDIQLKMDDAKEESTVGDAEGSAVETSAPADVSSRVREMEALVEELSAGLTPVPREESKSTSDTGSKGLVIVTGTTGSLGAHVLARLLNTGGESKVVALLRRGSGDVPPIERQAAAFAARGLDAVLLQSQRLQVVDGELDKPNLGLPHELYEQIQAHLTHIIHLGWPVNFQVPLTGFKDALVGVRKLIDLANSTRTPGLVKFIYGSSSGIFNKYTPSVPPRETPLQADIAVGQGYSESKWVAERLSQVAAERKVVKSVIVRIGQISGGVNGAWKTTEWLPSLVAASAALGALPFGEGVVSWTPAETAAEVFADTLEIPGQDGCTILHLRHPNPVSWMSVMEHFSHFLNVPIRPYAEWLRKLAAASQSVSDPQLAKQISPALALLDHFRAVEANPALPTDPAKENNGMSTLLDVEESCKLNAALRNAANRQLTAEDVEKWVGYWRKVGAFA